MPETFLLAAQRGVEGYNDITPRAGVAFDVFGNGNTALKVNVGKYLEAATNHNTYSLSNPAARVAGSAVLGGQPAVTRTWTDANFNYVPDCDLLATGTSDLRASGGDFCGPISNANFGRPVFSGRFDPDILEGWSVRPSDWQVGVSVQQKVLEGLSVEVGYYRRWLQNFTVSDNLAVGPEDFDTFSITAPSDPRLPNGGGYVISGLYNVKPEKFGQTDSRATWSRNYGSATSMHNGVQVNASARMAGGPTVLGRVTTGQTVTDNGELQAPLPRTSPPNPYCHNDPGLTTRVTGLASYTVPKIDVLLSSTFRSDQGSPLAANYTVTSALALPSLGRPLS